MPKNIKLLQEYDAAIGKDGKTFIPLEHTGMISYGTEENRNSDVNLIDWHAMLIGPQDVSLIHLQGKICLNLYLFFTVSCRSSYIHVTS